MTVKNYVKVRAALGRWLNTGSSNRLGAAPLGPDTALFRYVPLPAGRELYLPAAPAAATAGGLALYTPVSRTARAFHGLLLLAARLGVATALLRTRSLYETSATRHLCENRILDLLRDTLKRPDAHFAVYQGKLSMVRKPTILVMEESGAPLAFAKVGWNEVTRDLVEREHHALAFLARHPLRHGRTAPVLGYLDMPHSRILLSAPLRALTSAPQFELTPLHVAFLQEVGSLQLRRAPLCESAFWRRLSDRLAALHPLLGSEQLDILESAREVLERHLGNETLPWVLRLGDFLPWNFRANRKTNQIEVIDLEFAEAESSIGWDLFHFLVGTRRRFRPLDLAARRRSDAFFSYFEHFEVRPGLVPHLQLAYLLDLTIFFRHMWQDQALTPGAKNNLRIRLGAIAEAIAGLTTSEAVPPQAG
jgi:hypothetical protein